MIHSGLYFYFKFQVQDLAVQIGYFTVGKYCFNHPQNNKVDKIRITYKETKALCYSLEQGFFSLAS